MRHAVNRREFIHDYATTASVGLASAWLASTAAGIEPIARNGTPMFKFGLAAYSYRNLLTRDAKPLTLSDFVEDCATMNLDGTELTSYYFPDPTTDEHLHQIKQHCFRLGLDISGTAVGNDFGLSPGAPRDEQIASVKKWVDRAVILGAPVIRIFAGRERPDVGPQQAYRLMLEGIEECCDYAGQRGIYLALENHGGPTATPAGLLRFIHDVRSPWFGINLDTGNFFSEDPYADLEQIAPYAVNVQVKVVTSNVDKKNKKPADYRRIARMLANAGYRGYVVLEYEEGGDPRVECPKHVAKLREAFASVT